MKGGRARLGGDWLLTAFVVLAPCFAPIAFVFGPEPAPEAAAAIGLESKADGSGTAPPELEAIWEPVECQRTSSSDRSVSSVPTRSG